MYGNRGLATRWGGLSGCLKSTVRIGKNGRPEEEGERRGEGVSCSGEVLPDFGSEPQVINIYQLSHSKFFVGLIL